MIYNQIKSGEFISRPNRFIANVKVDGCVQMSHVKNTGRCRELLVPGAEVFLQQSDNPARKTKYDLISVYKGDQLINMDSQAPNMVFYEWAKQSGYFKNLTYIKPEYKYKNSRFDFYIEADGRKKLVEVKGVTLEKDGIVSFPDAPTQRGVKHINELIDALECGYEAYVFFIIQMENCSCFVPNAENHKEFADVLAIAKEKGVIIKALNCKVTPKSLTAKDFVDVKYNNFFIFQLMQCKK